MPPRASGRWTPAGHLVRPILRGLLSCASSASDENTPLQDGGVHERRGLGLGLTLILTNWLAAVTHFPVWTPAGLRSDSR